MTDLWAGIFFAVMGLSIALHCSQATLAEFKAGRALGGLEFGDFDRVSAPVGFWTIMVMNAFAALFGLGLLCFGGYQLAKYLGIAN